MGYPYYEIALQKLAETNDQAKGLLKILKKLETGIYICLWNYILTIVNKTSVKLQSCKTDLNTSILSLKTLKSSIQTFRDEFLDYENLGKQKSGNDVYVRSLKRKRREEVELSDSEHVRIESFLPIIDQLVSSLSERISAYGEIDSLFGFLRNLDKLSSSEINKYASKVVELYAEDLEDDLVPELIQFKELVKESGILSETESDSEEAICLENKMYKLIHKTNQPETYPNVCIFLKIYLVLLTTNCTSERSFSKLKLILNRLRSAMVQDRLNYLTIMSTASDLLKIMDFNDIIDDFAAKKSRKVIVS